MLFDPRLDLKLERDIPFPPALVWRAWTEPELLQQWFCPVPWRVSHAEIDLRPGGIFRTVMEGPEGESQDGEGCFLEVVRERRLIWTDALGPGYRPRPQSMITGVVLLEPGGEGTLYTAMALHASEEVRQQHAEMGFEQGWGTAYLQMLDVLKDIA